MGEPTPAKDYNKGILKGKYRREQKMVKPSKKNTLESFDIAKGIRPRRYMEKPPKKVFEELDKLKARGFDSRAIDDLSSKLRAGKYNELTDIEQRIYEKILDSIVKEAMPPSKTEESNIMLIEMLAKIMEGKEEEEEEEFEPDIFEQIKESVVKLFGRVGTDRASDDEIETFIDAVKTILNDGRITMEEFKEILKLMRQEKARRYEREGTEFKPIKEERPERKEERPERKEEGSTGFIFDKGMYDYVVDRYKLEGGPSFTSILFSKYKEQFPDGLGDKKNFILRENMSETISTKTVSEYLRKGTHVIVMPYDSRWYIQKIR